MQRKTLALLPLVLATLLAPSAARAQVTLQRKAVEGKINTKSVTKIIQTLTVAGQEIKTEASVEEASHQDIGKADAEGVTRVKRQGESLNVTVMAPGLEAKFDSREANPPKSDNPMVQVLLDTWAALSKAAFTLVVGKTGEITAVEGADKVVAAAAPAAAEAVRGELKLENLQREARQEARALPDKPVQKGDKWQRVEVMNIGAGQTLTFDTHYEYAGPVEQGGRKLEKVNIFLSTVKYSQEGDGLGGAKVTASDLKINSSTGYYLFDPELGLVVERYGNTAIGGSMTLEVNGMQFPSTLALTLDLLSNAKR